MNTTTVPRNDAKTPGIQIPAGFEFCYFSELLKRPICAGKIKDRVGKVTDLVFRLVEPFPEAVGILIDAGWGQQRTLIPWEKVSKVEDDAIFVLPQENNEPYPRFVDQTGWSLINEHLMGRTILDIDGRRIEVVNDVHFLSAGGKLFLVHVDVAFNGFLRKWGFRHALLFKENLISWHYVQPLSLEDTNARDSVTLSLTRKQIQELPGEDLADVLEELEGKEQEAVFSALDSDKAAEALVEAEPRAQRQLIASLRRDKARTILSEMSNPQLAALFSALPHDQMTAMMGLLSKEDAERIHAMISQSESTARSLMSSDFVSMIKDTKAGDALRIIRSSQYDHDAISYIYVSTTEQKLEGVVDLRDLVLAPDTTSLGDLMVSPVVSAQDDDVREDLAEIFAKYHYRLVPVVDAEDKLLGVIRYKDIMKGLIIRAIE